jgi:hypothetical protein
LRAITILWRIDPFLGNGHKINYRITAVARQQILRVVGNGVFYEVRAGII